MKYLFWFPGMKVKVKVAAFFMFMYRINTELDQK